MFVPLPAAGLPQSGQIGVNNGQGQRANHMAGGVD